MRRRTSKQTRTNHERWLVSYADFITLLFAFFVVLYSSSQVDKQKMGQLSTAIEGAFQQLGMFDGHSTAARHSEEPTGSRASKLLAAAELSAHANLASHAATASVKRAELDTLRRALEQALAPEITRREVALRQGPEGLVISLREIGFFDSGSARLKPDAQAAFSRIAELLRSENCDIRVEGHTDNVPIHTDVFQSNWELSTARATEIIRSLITRYAFSPERLSAAGYGEFHPAASNKTEEGRRVNRRIDLVVLGHIVSAPQPAGN